MTMEDLDVLGMIEETPSLKFSEALEICFKYGYNKIYLVTKPSDEPDQVETTCIAKCETKEDEYLASLKVPTDPVVAATLEDDGSYTLVIDKETFEYIKKDVLFVLEEYDERYSPLNNNKLWLG